MKKYRVRLRNNSPYQPNSGDYDAERLVDGKSQPIESDDFDEACKLMRGYAVGFGDPIVEQTINTCHIKGETFNVTLYVSEWDVHVSKWAPADLDAQ